MTNQVSPFEKDRKTGNTDSETDQRAHPQPPEPGRPAAVAGLEPSAVGHFGRRDGRPEGQQHGDTHQRQLLHLRQHPPGPDCGEGTREGGGGRRGEDGRRTMTIGSDIQHGEGGATGGAAGGRVPAEEEEEIHEAGGEGDVPLPVGGVRRPGRDHQKDSVAGETQPLPGRVGVPRRPLESPFRPSSSSCSPAVAEFLEANNLGEYASRLAKYTMDKLRVLSQADCLTLLDSDPDGLLLYSALKSSSRFVSPNPPVMPFI